MWFTQLKVKLSSGIKMFYYFVENDLIYPALLRIQVPTSEGKLLYLQRLSVLVFQCLCQCLNIWYLVHSVFNCLCDMWPSLLQLFNWAPTKSRVAQWWGLSLLPSHHLWCDVVTCSVLLQEIFALFSLLLIFTGSERKQSLEALKERWFWTIRTCRVIFQLSRLW